VTTDETYPADIFTEPDASPDTLANLGPLAALAGVWQGTQGQDINPKADGPEFKAYHERFEAQPIDPQTNGPQLLYGLRYHARMVEPGEIGTFHDQVGYLLWEPATGMVLMTLAIPRGQVAMAGGKAVPGSSSITLRADVDDPHFGISTSPFLDHAFHTTAWEITFRFAADDTWSYEQVTYLDVEGQPGLFEHRDSSSLVRVAPPTPNPLAPST
jgi:hypothetical protein